MCINPPSMRAQYAFREINARHNPIFRDSYNKKPLGQLRSGRFDFSRGV